MDSNQSATESKSSLILSGVTVFLVCFASLFFEITYPRILLFMRYYNALTIIPVAMLGIGAGAVFSYLMGKNKIAHFIFLLIFPLSIFLAFYVLIFYDNQIKIILSAAFVFFISSVIITYFFITGRSNRIYFYDLAGAGLGVATSFFIFPMIGGENSIILSAVVASLSSITACLNRSSFPRFRLWVILSPALIFAAIVSIFIYNVKTDKIDIIKMMPLAIKGQRDPLMTAHGILKDPNNVHLYKKWSLISRIDAVETTKSLWDSPYKGKRIYLYQNDLYFSYVPVTDIAHYRQPAYVLYKEPKSLIIGTGGGVDIAIARGNNSIKPVGVEIDPAIVSIMRDELNKTSANVYGKADISVIDGRAFVKKSKNAYDVILMNFTDLNIAFPNSQVFMEYYLYTVEALQDYLNALTDNGVVYINKWVSVGKGMKPELLRLTATAMDALEKSGVKDPKRHILIASENPRSTVVFPGAIRGFMLMKKSPFTSSEIAVIRETVRETHTILYPATEAIENNPFPWLIYAKDRSAVIKEFRNDIHPTHDDSPYFNEFDKTHSFARNVAKDFIRLLLILICAPVVFIMLVDRNLRSIKTPLYALFFASTGLSFMMFETYLIQKFNLVLGSPIYSITFTIGTILLSAGVGGFFSARLGRKISMIFVALIPFVMVVYYFLINSFAYNLLNLPLVMRLIVSGIFLFPIFFLLGLPFPGVIARAKDVFSARSAGIMYAVDASCATLAVVSSIIISMMYGFSFLLMIASAGYVLTALLYLIIMKLR
jgi:hypothetical protein